MILDVKSDIYLKSVINGFERNVSDAQYQNIIFPPKDNPGLPPLFIWDPITQYHAHIECPDHSWPLTVSMWTDDLVNEARTKNPRLIYDVNKNIVLVQRFYCCDFFSATDPHKYLSTDFQVMQQLDETLQERFSFIKHSRSIFTYQLRNYVFDQVVRGVNFTQISEGIACLHLAQFEHESKMSASAMLKFTDNLIFSFPSKDKIMNLFIEQVSRRKTSYENEMNNIDLGLSLSTDHTFKSGKSVGFYRECDNAFIHHLNNLFIILNDSRQIVQWRLCRSTSHEDITNCLEILSKRNSSKDVKLIYVDNCCAERNFYQRYFPNADIKLDLFHAAQRITHEIPKSPHYYALMNEVTFIFRQKDDLGAVRNMETPAPAEIVENITKFKKVNKQCIDNLPAGKSNKVYNELEKLSGHALKSCLSGIAPGQGTEANEALHRLLNRSLLRGATVISPELAEAVFTVIFHNYNEKISGNKHSCNKKIALSLIVHSNLKKESGVELQNSMQSSSSSTQVIQDKETEMDPRAEKLASFFKQKVYNMDLVIAKLQADCYRKGCNVVSFFLGDMFNSESIVEKEVDSFNYLEDNLLIFKRAKDDSVTGKYLNVLSNYQPNSISNLKIEIHKLCAANADSFNTDEILYGLEFEECNNGICKAVCEVFKRPIVLISGEGRMDVRVYVPTSASDQELIPLFIARDKDRFFGTVEHQNDVPVQCACGRKSDGKCCEINQRARCACVRRGKKCASSCRCRISNCENREKPLPCATSSNTTSKNCQCGFSKRDGSEEIVRCNDVVGQQRPRCPCFRNNIGCSVTCRCINCGNIFGKHIQVLSEDSPKLSRKRRLDVTLTRERTSKIMKEEDIPVRLPWTTLETCSLVIAAEIAKLMGSTNVLEKNVFKIYDIMRNLSNINIGAKSFKQIQSKIYHLKSQQMSSR